MGVVCERGPDSVNILHAGFLRTPLELGTKEGVHLTVAQPFTRMNGAQSGFSKLNVNRVIPAGAV